MKLKVLINYVKEMQKSCKNSWVKSFIFAKKVNIIWKYVVDSSKGMSIQNPTVPTYVKSLHFTLFAEDFLV